MSILINAYMHIYNAVLTIMANVSAPLSCPQHAALRQKQQLSAQQLPLMRVLQVPLLWPQPRVRPSSLPLHTNVPM